MPQLCQIGIRKSLRIGPLAEKRLRLSKDNIDYAGLREAATATTFEFVREAHKQGEEEREREALAETLSRSLKLFACVAESPRIFHEFPKFLFHSGETRAPG